MSEVVAWRGTSELVAWGQRCEAEARRERWRRKVVQGAKWIFG
jgi:hypothetical protein